MTWLLEQEIHGSLPVEPKLKIVYWRSGSSLRGRGSTMVVSKEIQVGISRQASKLLSPQ